MINGDGKWGNAGLDLGDHFLCVEIDDRSLVVEGERNNSQAPALSVGPGILRFTAMAQSSRLWWASISRSPTRKTSGVPMG